MRIRAAALSILPLLIASAATGQAIRGAFAVLHDQPTAADLTQARNDGLNLVILQWSETPGTPFDESAVKQFIARADSAGLPYLLGLYYIGDWKGHLRKYVRRSLEIRDALKCDTTAGFRGWYVALEVGNERTSDNAEVAAAFAPFQQVARVAMTVYFNPDSSFPDSTALAARVSGFAHDFDVVMLQDGVGARAITDYERDLEPYYRAVKAVARGGPKNTQFWADVEAFACGQPLPGRQCNGGWTPGDRARIAQQITTACSFTDAIVGYDLMEFMAPLGSGPKLDAYQAFTTAAAGAKNCASP